MDDVLSKKNFEREGLIEDIGILEKRLKDLRKSLSKKMELKEKYTEHIETSEKALNKIADSTKTLLDFVAKKKLVLERELN